MPGSLQIQIFDKQESVCQALFTGAVELGRQRDAREVLYSSRSQGGRARLVIARLDEDTVSRDHALVEPLESDRVKLTNTSAKVSIRLADGSELRAGQFCERPLPTALILGQKTVHIQGRGPGAGPGPSRASESRKSGTPLHGLPGATLPPGSLSVSARFSTQSLQELFQNTAQPSAYMEKVVGWLEATMEVFQSAVSSPDFFQKAAQAVIEIVGLDHGHVLLYSRNEWKTAASCASPGCGNAGDLLPSRTMLDRVLQEKRTFWQDHEELELNNLSSLSDVEVVVASPILSGQGEVIGALYGDCRQNSLSTAAPKVTRVEAVLIELLARGVAVGLARLEQERAALTARVRFEQFFTPQLAQQLARESNLLEGRDVEVTILFCDIRGFSRISERLGSEGTVRWVSQIMEVLSDCVLRHSGVLVDFIGDELMAMWGAPVAQPDHARLACSAALDMLGLLPGLNERWQPVLQEPFGIGFGINTGTARVGNTGTRHKFKYAPLGKTVDLASRVQAATKHLRSPLVVTEYTHARLDETFHACKLCRVRVVNRDEPVDLYELLPEGRPHRQDFKVRYEAALQQFTDKNFRVAARALGYLMAEVPEDGPALVLLKRAVNALVEGPGVGHPVWDLPGK